MKLWTTPLCPATNLPQHLTVHAAWAAAGRGGQLRYHRADGALDEQIRDEDYVRETFDLPLLAAVPDLTGKGAGDSYYKTTSGKEAQS